MCTKQNNLEASRLHVNRQPNSGLNKWFIFSYARKSGNRQSSAFADFNNATEEP